MQARVTTRTQAAADARRRLKIVFSFFAAVALASLATKAFGQVKFKQIPTPKDMQTEAAVKTFRSALKTYGNSAPGTADGKSAAAKRYVEEYVTFRMTQQDALPEITSLVSDVTSAISAAQRRGNVAASQNLIRWFAPRMTGIAQGNFQPAARIAATIALGQINQDPGDRNRAPRPLSSAFKTLVTLYQNKNGSVPDGVRAAALHGLERHVKLTFASMDARYKAGVAALMQKLLDEPVPQGRTPAAHAYMQRYAVSIQDYLGQDPAKLATKLVGVSTDKGRHDLIALYAAEQFGRSGAAANANVAAAGDVLDQWTARAFRAFESEAKRLEFYYSRPPQASKQPETPEETLIEVEEEEQVVGEDGMGYGSDYGGGGDMVEEEEPDYGGMDMGDYGDMQMMMGDSAMGGSLVTEYKDQPAEVVATRRRLNHVLQQIHIGVTGSAKVGAPSQPGGLLAVADEVSKAKIDLWLTEMESVVTTLNDRSLEDQKSFLESIQEQVEVLRDLAGDAAKESVEDAGGDVGEIAGAGEAETGELASR